MGYMKICTEYDRFYDNYEIVQYEEREDGWYVETGHIDGEGWRLYASPEARKSDVRQLLRKEYDVKY